MKKKVVVFTDYLLDKWWFRVPYAVTMVALLGFVTGGMLHMVLYPPS